MRLPWFDANSQSEVAGLELDALLASPPLGLLGASVVGESVLPVAPLWPALWVLAALPSVAELAARLSVL